MGARTRRLKHKQQVAAPKASYPPNEWIFSDYIERNGSDAINKKWVFWMLRVLHEAHRQGKPITKDFLATCEIAKGEPPIKAFQDGA